MSKDGGGGGGSTTMIRWSHNILSYIMPKDKPFKTKSFLMVRNNSFYLGFPLVTRQSSI